MHDFKEFYDAQGRVFASSFSEYEKGLLMDVWGGAVSKPENIMAVLEHSQKEVSTHKMNHWLCDVCNIQGDLSEIVGTAKVGLEQVLKTGEVEKFAFITRRANNAERIELTNMLQQYGVQVQTFASLCRALEWLVVPEIEENVWDEAEVINF